MASDVSPILALNLATAAATRLAQRVEAELGFARSLIELLPAHKRPLADAIAAAQKKAASVFASSDLSKLADGVAQVEQLLAPAGRLAKQYTIYCVGHAHIDMNWMWGWPETVAVCNDTFTTVLKLMEEFPDFVFSQSQASVYAAMQQYNPALLEKIRQRVKEGRWEVTASHWVEGDRNMVSGESLARHLLYTRKYLQELFQLSPEDVAIDWSPDTFGHPLSVPMYLRQGAVKYVYLHRPGELGPRRPGAFWWQSPDGSRVLVRNDMANGYNGQITPAITSPLVSFARETGLKFVMFVYGVGDHGGGPTRHDLARAIEMDAWPIFPNVRFSRAHDFYSRLEREGGKLPTLACELNTEVAGCLTTQSLIKRSNRIAEHRLLDAETACTIAQAAGRVYPQEAFETAWCDTLFSHFHDILPGSNVHDSRTWTHALFQKTLATTSMAETLALRELAAKVDTSIASPASDNTAATGAGAGYGSAAGLPTHANQADGSQRPLLVFNPTAWERREIVQATLWWDSREMTDALRQRPLSVRLADGDFTPAQKLEHGVYWGHAFTRIAFAVTVPPLGYTTCTVVEQSVPAAATGPRQITPPYHCFYVMPDRRPEGLQNERLRLQVDPLTGGIASLVDVKTGRSLVSGCTLQYVLEKAHAMTAWTIDNAVVQETPRVLAIERKGEGDCCAMLEVRLQVHDSEFTLTYELRQGDPRLHLHLRGTWVERGSRNIGVPSLVLSVPTRLQDATGRYEIPFAEISRPWNQGQELPALNYAAVVGRVGKILAGVLLLNDSKHGHALAGSELRLTLIRSAYDPDPLPEVGQHEVHLALLPFEGSLPPAQAIRLGKSFNRPLRVIPTSVHPGSLPPEKAAATVQGEAILLSLKKAQASDGMVMLFSNPTASSVTAAVALDQSLLGRFASAQQVDLMECPVKASAVRLAGDRLSLKIPAGSIASVLLGR